MRRPAPPERFEAWLITGPIGHLAAFLADLGVLLFGLGRSVLRRRLERAQRARG